MCVSPWDSALLCSSGLSGTHSSGLCLQYSGITVWIYITPRQESCFLRKWILLTFKTAFWGFDVVHSSTLMWFVTLLLCYLGYRKPESVNEVSLNLTQSQGWDNLLLKTCFIWAAYLFTSLVMLSDPGIQFCYWLTTKPVSFLSSYWIRKSNSERLQKENCAGEIV